MLQHSSVLDMEMKWKDIPKRVFVTYNNLSSLFVNLYVKAMLLLYVGHKKRQFTTAQYSTVYWLYDKNR